MEKEKTKKGTKKDIKYVMFYLFVLLYFIVGSIIIYHYIQNYKHFQKLPKHIGSLYIFRDNYLIFKTNTGFFLLKLCFDTLFNKKFFKGYYLKVCEYIFRDIYNFFTHRKG